eukprot:5275852-Karenia_brevis.AAC.1
MPCCTWHAMMTGCCAVLCHAMVAACYVLMAGFWARMAGCLQCYANAKPSLYCITSSHYSIA